MTPMRLIQSGLAQPATPDPRTARLRRGMTGDDRRDPDTQVRYLLPQQRGERQSV